MKLLDQVGHSKTMPWSPFATFCANAGVATLGCVAISLADVMFPKGVEGRETMNSIHRGVHYGLGVILIYSACYMQGILLNSLGSLPRGESDDEL